MNTYTIHSVNDLAKVPPDRIDACLADLRDYVAFIRDVLHRLERPDWILKVTADGFVWKDDSKTGLDGFIISVKSSAGRDSKGG